jgi:ABC-2 type transport system ATP-binding protein
MTATPAIETRSLTKRYRAFTAVNSLTITIDQGEIFGFLGPNGAGKTTTIKMLTTVAKPTTGTALINGHDITKDPLHAKQRIGYMPDVAGFYGDMTAETTLLFYSDFYHLPRTDRQQRTTDILERLQLADCSHKKVKTYSRGMKQKLAFASAIIHQPTVLILDEPTIGLDPPTIHFFRGLIRELNKEGVTIFLSSHTLSEIEAICHRVGIINKGSLVAVDTIDSLRSRITTTRNQIVTVETEGTTPDTLDALRAIPGVVSVQTQNTKLLIELERSAHAVPLIARTLVQHNINILSLTSKEADLEAIFLSLIKEEKP